MTDNATPPIPDTETNDLAALLQLFLKHKADITKAAEASVCAAAAGVAGVQGDRERQRESHTHTHTHSLVNTHIHTHSYTHTHTLTHTRTHSHTYTHSYTLIHTHTHSHSLVALIRSQWLQPARCRRCSPTTSSASKTLWPNCSREHQHSARTTRTACLGSGLLRVCCALAWQQLSFAFRLAPLSPPFRCFCASVWQCVIAVLARFQLHAFSPFLLRARTHAH